MEKSAHKKLLAIKTVGAFLALLYALSFMIESQLLRFGISGVKLSASTLMFIALFSASLGVIGLKEWARKFLIVGNIVLAIFLLMAYLATNRLLLVSYILISVTIVLYFSLTRIKAQFVYTGIGSKGKANWRSILIIDDDESDIKIVRPILISHGYSVLTATSGEEGLRIAKVQKPDLIILDVILPGMKGRDVCKKIKEDKEIKHIPVMFVTAKDSPDDIRAEMEVGAIKHLTKPVNAKILISTIREILGS